MIGFDGIGRRVWSDDVMRAAETARKKASQGGPPLTPEQAEAARALRRIREDARRRAKRAANPGPDEEAIAAMLREPFATVRTVMRASGLSRYRVERIRDRHGIPKTGKGTFGRPRQDGAATP